MFPVVKWDFSVEARTCSNGSTQRECIDRDEAVSPTAMTESILITAKIYAKKWRDVIAADTQNAFGQTDDGLDRWWTNQEAREDNNVDQGPIGGYFDWNRTKSVWAIYGLWSQDNVLYVQMRNVL